MGREAKVFAPFQDLLDQIGGYLGREGVEGGLEVVVWVSEVAENARELVDE